MITMSKYYQLVSSEQEGRWWSSDRASDSEWRGPGFDPNRRHGVVDSDRASDSEWRGPGFDPNKHHRVVSSKTH